MLQTPSFQSAIVNPDTSRFIHHKLIAAWAATNTSKTHSSSSSSLSSFLPALELPKREATAENCNPNVNVDGSEGGGGDKTDDDIVFVSQTKSSSSNPSSDNKPIVIS